MDYKLERKKAKIEDVCSKYVYPWLRDVGVKFKAFGAFPICLSDFYTDPMDKQVAEIVSIIVPKKSRDKYMLATRKILGDSPWEKVRKRNFMEFAGKGFVYKTVGLDNYYMFNILDWIWEVCCESNLSLEQAVLGELGLTERRHKTPLENIYAYEDLKYRLKMVLTKMALRDGFGCGLWTTLKEEELPCPMNVELRKIMHVFYPMPGHVYDEDVPEVTSFMGFEKPIDFLYSAWGYQYLRRHEPKRTNDFEEKLAKWCKTLMLRYNLHVDIPTDSMI